MNSNFTEYRQAIDRRLSEFLNEQLEKSRYSGDKYPFTLYDPLNYIMSGGGKRIRPILVLLACEAFGGIASNALNAAIAVEILHNFTLVHDDIMDNASTRRGRETIHKKWDVNSAILVGDELIGLSYRAILDSQTENLGEILKAFTDGVIEVCEGQALDKEFEISSDVLLGDYIIMIKKKTAALLKTSAVIGALIGGAGKSDIKLISEYAENIGLAFQIQDDLLDVFADEGEFGKKIGGDISEKKKTYLYLKALEILKGNGRDEFLFTYNAEINDSEKLESVIKVYNEICVLESARNEIKKYTETANVSLMSIKNEVLRRKLEEFSDMLLNRNY